jgi:flagellar biosynthesis/type III secretory pathway M-ring protein FliF/YscJ
MSKGRKFAVMVIAAVVAVGLIFFLNWSNEPEYQGRPISV